MGHIIQDMHSARDRGERVGRSALWGGLLFLLLAAIQAGCSSAPKVWEPVPAAVIAPVPKAILTVPGGGSWQIEYEEGGDPAGIEYPETIPVFTIMADGERVEGMIFRSEDIAGFPMQGSAYRITVPNHLERSASQGWRLSIRSAVFGGSCVKTSLDKPLWAVVPVVNEPLSLSDRVPWSRVMCELKAR